MNTHNLPKMMFSYTEGWQDLIKAHPAVMKMFTMYVMPMSLIPPVMFLYASIVTPGAVFPAVVPQFSAMEALAVAVGFYVVELAMVALMASIIQQMGEVVGVTPAHEEAFMLAAVAPTPLWLASLALFIPSLWVNGLVVALAWVASAALIFHGVTPLFKLQDPGKARLMGWFVLMTGIMAWIGLMVVMALILSMVVGLR